MFFSISIYIKKKSETRLAKKKKMKLMVNWKIEARWAICTDTPPVNTVNDSYLFVKRIF